MFIPIVVPEPPSRSVDTALLTGMYVVAAIYFLLVERLRETLSVWFTTVDCPRGTFFIRTPFANSPVNSLFSFIDEKNECFYNLMKNLMETESRQNLLSIESFSNLRIQLLSVVRLVTSRMIFEK